ncbi:MULTISPECIES: hypothetical protein [unclassified Enterococcus]|uniref:hypothetical protein n=1 Tax=unclassified Enterococcus TaxID=2608891 RepID=UPI0015575E08|nr:MULTISPECIES: hypothetical protein [unclassified Enterococcus]MBS7576923.1 hypothetical protein [Enterococcus sp. MMGLQ5-2]MBS7584330.1 hypothetical protein [Enterococcus sp. MMGLQ5-1]NPD12186.1 hypothetical protein [Enterococcus sp. MMGLQ5-1]NPD36758.1 hypothetical protein [Enterococcus sp. MMGLQ5-2]
MSEQLQLKDFQYTEIGHQFKILNTIAVNIYGRLAEPEETVAGVIFEIETLETSPVGRRRTEVKIFGPSGQIDVQPGDLAEFSGLIANRNGEAISYIAKAIQIL